MEIRTEAFLGFDFSPVNLLRLHHYTGMDLTRTAHRRLTPVTEVLRFDVSQRQFRPGRKTIELEVVQDGTCGRSRRAWIDGGSAR